MIKKYIDFINERNSLNEGLDYDFMKEFTMENIGDVYNKNRIFYDNFNLFIIELSEEFRKSFTEIVSSKMYFEWSDIENILKRNNLSMNDIRTNKELIFKNIRCYDSINGIVDYVLYTLDKKYPLGGDKLSDNEDEELFIKYSYGYHNNKYGEEYILQSYNTLGEYYRDICKKILLQVVLENIGYSDGIFDINFLKRFKNKVYNNFISEEGNDILINFHKFEEECCGLADGSSEWLRYDRLNKKPGIDNYDKLFKYVYNSIESFLFSEISGTDCIELENINDDYIKLKILID